MKILFKQISIGKYKLDVAVLIWFALAAIAVSLEMMRGLSHINNYLIFKYVFFHTVEQTNLYSEYPQQYFDMNHYGPSFSVLIAPFAVLPVYLGCFLWSVANAAMLYYAIMHLSLSRNQCLSILLITAIEMMTATHNVQFNPMLASWIVLAFILVEKEKEYAATFLIAAGFLVKLYGIVALASFFFSKHKMRFTLSFLGWLFLIACLPMLFSSPTFVLHSYADWYQSLVEKNLQNAGTQAEASMQDISVQGMARRLSNNLSLSQLWVVAPAGIMVLLPLLRVRAYGSLLFRLSYLAMALITVVIFSSGAESPTYVIAVAGVAIWFVAQPKPYQPWVIAVLVFVLLLTSLSATDLFPYYVRHNFVKAYSLKALPCFIVWLIIWAQLMFKKYPVVEGSAIPIPVSKPVV